MPDHKKTKKTLKRVLKWTFSLLAVALVALIVWTVLVPMITANAITTYDSYTVETGDISTTKSFSATLSVKKSETFNSEEECTVRAIYVQSGDEVKKDDPLILLSTGELFVASFDGVVNEIRVEVGDWVWPMFSIVQICDLEHLEVSMNVDEYDVKELSLGQSCTVSVISLGVDFDTVLAHINRVSQAQGNVAYYSVACDLTVPENVLPGMQATVTLPSSSVQGVTTLAVAALSFDEEKKPYVLLKDDSGAFEKVSVETGLSDGMTVEIKSGLTPGQTVYVKSGTESVQPAVTLEQIYQTIFGKTVVINDMSSRGGPGESGGGTPPTGENGEMPSMGEGGPSQGTQSGTAATDASGNTSGGTQTGTAATDAGGNASGGTQSGTAATDASGNGQTGTADATGSATAGGQNATVTATDGTGNTGGPSGPQPSGSAPAQTDTATAGSTSTTQEEGTGNANE